MNNKNREATAKDILRILNEHSLELMSKLPVSPVQFSFPTDGKGARIKVSVKAGQKKKMPKTVQFALNSDIIRLPLEIVEDYQEYQRFNDNYKETIGQSPAPMMKNKYTSYQEYILFADPAFNPYEPINNG